jgi:pyruvate,water dikinase
MTAPSDQSFSSNYWERRDSRFPLPISNHLWELLAPARHEGIRQGFERFGSAVEYFEFTRIRGRQYGRIQYIENPEKLMERRQIAERVLASKRWREDCDAWPTFRNCFSRRLIEYGRRDPQLLNAVELHEMIVNLRAIFAEGIVQHFVQQPASMIPVGDWVRQTGEWTGVSTPEIIATLQAFRSTCDSHLGVIDELVHAIRSNAEAMAILTDPAACPKEQLQRLPHVSRELSARFDAYTEEYGDRIITGFDISDMALRELPEVTISIIASRIDASPMKNSDTSRLQRIRELVPAAKLDEFEDGLAEARAAYGLHDEDARITYLWPLGLLRRSVLAAAEQLVQKGRLRIAEDVFHTTPSELDCLMAGESSPSVGELSWRAEQWWSWANNEPPSSFGERPAYPDHDTLGCACARITSAIMFYLAETENHIHRGPKSSRVVQGLAASPGCYQGRARIIRDPSDFARLSRGDVLVARTTSPAYNVVMPNVGAIVTDRGGTLCHAAIIAREFSIPAVVGTNLATTQIPEGAHVLVDGTRGFVAVRA